MDSSFSFYFLRAQNSLYYGDNPLNIMEDIIMKRKDYIELVIMVIMTIAMVIIVKNVTVVSTTVKFLSRQPKSVYLGWSYDMVKDYVGYYWNKTLAAVKL